MSCYHHTNPSEDCLFKLSSFGTHDVSRLVIDGRDRTQRNWTELSIPEIMPIPTQKPDIEHLDQVYVDVEITCAKLIETPYAYKTYDRLPSTLELSAAQSAINLAVVNIQRVVTAVGVILAIPLLPHIPAVTALQVALAAVVAAAATLTTRINDALAALAAPCLTASALIALLQGVLAAVAALNAALNALVLAANALAAAVAAIPVVGPAVAAAVAVLLAAIHLITSSLAIATEAILGTITLIGNTKYFALLPNEEGTCLSGRKLVIEGVLKQKIVYTGLVTTQSVHSAHNEIPFNAYIIPYAKFENLDYLEDVSVVVDPSADPCVISTISGFAFDPENPPIVDLCEEFCVSAYIEDIFACAIDCRTVFKNITLFLLASPKALCP